MSWPVRSTRVAYENPWIVVREDEVVRPDGSEGVYGVVELRRPAVFVVAVTDADEVVLVTVDRHTVGPSVEVPAGGTDGEDPIVAARRELAEETGLEAGTWRQVGTMMALNGICRAPEVVLEVDVHRRMRHRVRPRGRRDSSCPPGAGAKPDGPPRPGGGPGRADGCPPRARPGGLTC